MNPQQQFLMQQGVMPSGIPTPDGSGEMITPSMPTEDQQKAMADLQASQMQSFQNQQRGIDDLSQYTNALQGQEVQTDLTPLAALTDAWTGSKFAQSYRAPESGKEKQATVAALKQALNKEKGNLTDNEVALLKAKISALTTQSIFGQKKDAKSGDDTAKNAKDAKEDKDKKASEALAAREKLITRDQAKQMEGIIAFNGALNAYEDAINRYPVTGRLVGKGAQDIDSAYSQVKIKYKEAANLGALSGPDIGLVVEGIAPAAGIGGVWSILKGGGEEGLKLGLKGIREQTKGDFDAKSAYLKSAYREYSAPVLQEYANQYSKVSRPTATAKPSGSAASKYVVGKTKKDFGGKSYTYQGGDPAASKSWKAD